ncbi:hypothetical protein [Lactobacillus johnsonii]|uniref:hypothetical protein n=1 Tax=Lactobacillus johnsonii TaxID=33959 RepID=UPI001FB20F0A|nr:hypothetical protein [Lactobacillus johnsonii]UOC05702.1 hypothetical protein LC811_07665 [Lactobacillus johnsonii]
MKQTEPVKTLPITEDEFITLATNANNLTAGLDYLESMALNMESTNQHEIEQLSRLIAGMKELSAKNAKLLANIGF